MVRGLTIFQEWFKDFEDQYVLIGGTAAWISMEEAGLPFRGTKDLDIVLHIEVLTPAFGEKFWDFVRVGGYLKKEGVHREHTGKIDVRIIDFVDTGHPALLRMWANRQRGYRTMGYRVGCDETTNELY